MGKNTSYGQETGICRVCGKSNGNRYHIYFGNYDHDRDEKGEYPHSSDGESREVYLCSSCIKRHTLLPEFKPTLILLLLGGIPFIVLSILSFYYYEQLKGAYPCLFPFVAISIFGLVKTIPSNIGAIITSMNPKRMREAEWGEEYAKVLMKSELDGTKYNRLLTPGQFETIQAKTQSASSQQSLGVNATQKMETKQVVGEPYNPAFSAGSNSRESVPHASGGKMKVYKRYSPAESSLPVAEVLHSGGPSTFLVGTPSEQLVSFQCPWCEQSYEISISGKSGMVNCVTCKQTMLVTSGWD